MTDRHNARDGAAQLNNPPPPSDVESLIERLNEANRQRGLLADRALAQALRAQAAEARLREVEGVLEPFQRLAREVTEPGPDREWLKEWPDVVQVFAFAGGVISLGDLRKLAALPPPPSSPQMGEGEGLQTNVEPQCGVASSTLTDQEGEP